MEVRSEDVHADASCRCERTCHSLRIDNGLKERATQREVTENVCVCACENSRLCDFAVSRQRHTYRAQSMALPFLWRSTSPFLLAICRGVKGLHRVSVSHFVCCSVFTCLFLVFKKLVDDSVNLQHYADAIGVDIESIERILYCAFSIDMSLTSEISSNL